MSNTPSPANPSSTQSLFNLTKGTTYDRDEIYAHSTDGHGHYERARVKLTPWVEAEIAALVASKVRKYRTVEDFIRNAIVHQLHYEMTTVHIPVQQTISHEIVMSDLNRIECQVESWDMAITKMNDMGESLLAAGAWEELLEHLSKWDQEMPMYELPFVKEREMREAIDNLHDRLKRARRRDFD